METYSMRVLIDETRLQTRISEMALEIDEYYLKQEWYKNTAQPVHILGVMLGAIPFTEALIEKLSVRIECHWIRMSSYCGKTSKVRLPKILAEPKKRFRGDTPFNNNILLIDDILETGETLKIIKEKYEWPGDDTRIAVLLRKPGKTLSGITADFVGFDIPDEFVVGYGLDCNGRYRDLPYVAVWSENEYQAS